MGLCKGANSAATLAETDYIIYTHDDMYFLPNWDFFLEDEVKKVKNNFIIFSSERGRAFITLNSNNKL